VHAGGVPHIFGSSLIRATTFLYTLPLIKGLYKTLRASKVPRFPNLGILGIPAWESWVNDIWMQPPWLITKKYYKGEGGGFL